MENRFNELKNLCKQRIDLDQDRLTRELEQIRKFDLVGQFHELWATKKRGERNRVNSLVAYALGITSKYPEGNFEPRKKYVSGRTALPDIDLDFDDARRDEVFQYVRQKYGQDHFAQVITFGTMMARGSIRDAGRALGLSYDFCDRIAKLIPFNPNQNEKVGFLRKCLGDVMELRQAYGANADIKKLIDAAMRLEGVARHSSTHACAVVITPEPLTEYLPLQRGTNEGDIITQYEMHAVEDLGLLKMDFLGLANLTIIENTLKQVAHSYGTRINIDNIPLDDQKTFKLLQDGNTTGVFQLEGSGMRRYLEELKPTVFEDIATMIALYRPGPMELIPEFIARKHGRKKIEYLHPKLEPILKKTYGVMVYQEQLMAAAQALAGFTLPEADILRKAVGKKIKKLLQEQKDKVIEGCKKNGVPGEIAEKFWKLIEPFDRYGFNLAHAISYALISYQTAYLKAHWPVEFMAAWLNSASGDIERVALLIEEAQAMNIEVRAPEINESMESFTVVDKNKIRFGLAAVKNVGVNVVKAIIAEREKTGQFISVEDFAKRVQHKDLNKKSLESLIKCGALDGLNERSILLTNVDQLLEYGREMQRGLAGGQASLFDLADLAAGLPPLRLKEAPRVSRSEKLMWEKELLGLFVSDHPFKDFQRQIYMESGVAKIKDVVAGRNDRAIKVGGVVTKIQKILTKTGKPMVFSWLEDLTAKIEVVVFPDVLEQHPNAFQENSVLVVSGRLNDRDGVPKLLCESVRPIAMLN